MVLDLDFELFLLLLKTTQQKPMQEHECIKHFG
jgi:hypothetical protein